MPKHYTHLLLIGLVIGLPLTLAAQVTGGKYVFPFLSFAPSARVTALGGALITVQDDDVNLANANPAALNPTMNGRLSFNHDFYLAGIQHGYVAFGKHLKKTGMTFHAGIRYLKYGEIKRADDFGTVNGTIKAGETALTLGAARPLTSRLTLGLNLHLANATLDTYQASAIAADAGFLYVDTLRRFTAALVLKNKGAQLSTYARQREDLPYDIQLGLSKRLRYLPFRLGLIFHHLQTWDIRYDDPNAESNDIVLFGEEQNTKNGNTGLDNFFRHTILNGEFLLGRNEGFRLRFGYNHLRKRELSVANFRSLAGFSGGIGLKINRFRVDMGYAAYHLAGGAVHFSLGTNLNDFMKRS